MGETLDSLKTFARFSIGLYGYLRHTMTPEQATALVQARLGRRVENFLSLVKRTIYDYPASPYLPLLQWAGCEFPDLCDLVRDKGLDAALGELRRQGVYITFEEFKGRSAIMRGSWTHPVTADDFDNPLLSPAFHSETGGSTGRGTRVPRTLEHSAALSAHNLLVRAAHGVLDAPFALWRGILPDGSGINNMLYAAYYGKFPDKWFTQLKPWASQHARYTIASYAFVALGRLFGAPIPFPQYVPTDQASVVARWAVETILAHGKCLLIMPVSRGLRVALAAGEAGMSLAGATFMIAGEPLTPGKAQGIADTGARYFSTYGMTETGRVAMGCAHPTDCTDVHLLKDAFALIPFPHQLDGFEVNVPAFHITTLLPSTSKILLNVEVDDYGLVEERDCGCLWSTLGFTTHLRGIRSYRKLTGEGVTLVGGAMVHILEQVLPARFGGSPLDYQLLEQEDERGLTRLYLVISPRVIIADERAVLETVEQALRETSVAADTARVTWQQAGSFVIKRMEPIWTERGKFNPLHVQRHIN